MNDSELYKLPKDILVKLLVDVQEELKTELDMYKDIISNMYDESVNICEYKG